MVIAIILGTAIVTLGGIIRIGPFKNISDKYTKILVGALLVELIAAFIGVYKTLPQLQFHRAEEYEFEIEYSDFLKQWQETLSQEEKSQLNFFIENKGRRGTCLGAYYDFVRLIDQHHMVSGSEDPERAERWKNSLSAVDIRYYNFFLEKLHSNLAQLDALRTLLEKYTRYVESSGKIGKGTMYVSYKGINYQGVVIYRFPGVELFTVLECKGYKKENIFELRFEQAPSALAVDNFFIPRPGGTFKTIFTKDKIAQGTYKGEMPNNLGTIRIILK